MTVMSLPTVNTTTDRLAEEFDSFSNPTTPRSRAITAMSSATARSTRRRRPLERAQP